MRSYNSAMEVEIAARLEMQPDGTGRVTSVYGELDTTIPPMPPLMESKYAILKLCEKGARVPEVGKRQSDSIFYLWFDMAEFRQVAEEIKSVRSNTMDGRSVGQTGSAD
jgi:hypothetical protein